MLRDHIVLLLCVKNIVLPYFHIQIPYYIGYFWVLSHEVAFIKSVSKYQLYHVMFAIFVTVLINMFTSSPFTAQVKDVMKDVMADLQQTNSEKILLSWVRQSTKNYKDINVVNFSSSWTDGLAFNALIHSHRCCYFMGAFFENHRTHFFHI